MRIRELRCILLLVIIFIGGASAITNSFRGMSGLINKVAKKMSSKRPTALTRNDLRRSGSLVPYSFKDSFHPLCGVISEMRTSLDTLKSQAGSELELDVRGGEFLDRIGEYYYKDFLNRCAQYTYHRQYAVLKDEIVQECTNACMDLTSGFPDISYVVSSRILCTITFPNSPLQLFSFKAILSIGHNYRTYSFVVVCLQGTLSELQADIDNYIDQIPTDQASTSIILIPF